MSNHVHQLAEVFAVFAPDFQLHPVKVGPTLYADLDKDFANFKDHLLLSMHSFTSDWPCWEKHPAGEEFVMLLSGRANLILKTDAGDETLYLDNPGSYVIVPRDTWHKAKISESATMLFVTPGEGTQNSEKP